MNPIMSKKRFTFQICINSAIFGPFHKDHSFSQQTFIKLTFMTHGFGKGQTFEKDFIHDLKIRIWHFRGEITNGFTIPNEYISPACRRFCVCLIQVWSAPRRRLVSRFFTASGGWYSKPKNANLGSSWCVYRSGLLQVWEAPDLSSPSFKVSFEIAPCFSHFSRGFAIP